MLKNTLLFAPVEHREVMLKPKVYYFICLHINDIFVHTSFLRYPKIVSTVSIRQTDTSRTVPMRILKWRNVITEIEQIIYRNRINYLQKQNRLLTEIEQVINHMDEYVDSAKVRKPSIQSNQMSKTNLFDVLQGFSLNFVRLKTMNVFKCQKEQSIRCFIEL